MEAAKTARTLARIQCTKQSNIVLGIFDGDAVTKGQYRLEVDRFHERVKAVQKAQQNIFELLDEEELEAENEEADKYDAKHIKNVLLLINERREDELVSGQKNSIVSPITAKLPKLQLKGFSGDVQEWLPFWEQFQHNVDQRKDLADSTKFFQSIPIWSANENLHWIFSPLSKPQCGQNIMGPKHHLKAQKHQPKTPPKNL